MQVWLPVGVHRDESFAGYLGEADIQTEFDGIVWNKAIYQKVATAMAMLSFAHIKCSPLSLLFQSVV